MGKKTNENVVSSETKNTEIISTPSVTAIDLKEQKKDYNRLVGLIKREYVKVEKSSLTIAFALHHIYVDELFRIDGFKNISECGEEHFNLGKTTVNAFINVIERFAKVDENGHIIHGDGQGIKEDFEKFSWSKLCLLTSVPDEYLGEFYSSMTAKEIREKKAEIAKLISCNDESNIIEANEDVVSNGKSGHDKIGADESGADASADDEEPNAEEMARRCLVPLYSCTTMEEFENLFDNKELLFAMGLHVDKLCRDIAKDKIPHIEVMFTYID